MKSANTQRTSRLSHMPLVSFALLALITACCLGAELIMTKNPAYLDLANCAHAPNHEFLFGTDTLGRDIFSCIWYGGRISILIGFLSTALSTIIAIFYGTLSGIAPPWLDALLMRLTELLLSIPSLLTVIFLQAVWGETSVLSLSVILGLTSWYGIARIIRTEVRQLWNCEYIMAARCIGGSFLHILRRHLAPNFVSSIMFMVVLNIRLAIASESTLSFLGLGLPLETISWGSMLSLAENALLTRSWWIILIPGAFLITLLVCVTNIGNWLRQNITHAEGKL